MEAWQVNQELIESCCNQLGNADEDEYRAASVIIDEIWKRIRKSHKLRIVK